MPVAITWILKAGARLLAGWWIPLIAVVGAWALEQTVGAISWGLLAFGQVLLDGMIHVISTVPAPAAVAAEQWREVSGAAVDVGAVAGLWTAIGVYVSSLGLRMVAWVLTFGRY